MSRIEILCVGKLKFQELQALAERYLRRIGYYSAVTMSILPEFKSKNEETVHYKETELILKKLKPGDFVIALDEKGDTMTSPEFARFLERKMVRQRHSIVFVIGGYTGLSSGLDSRVNKKISFSRLTMAHDIFRIVFLEQLYRAFTIIKGKTYHR